MPCHKAPIGPVPKHTWEIPLPPLNLLVQTLVFVIWANEDAEMVPTRRWATVKMAEGGRRLRSVEARG
jgi:hypothetical protein